MNCMLPAACTTPDKNSLLASLPEFFEIPQFYIIK